MSWNDRQVFEVPRQKGGIQFFRAVHPATVTRFGGPTMWWLHDSISWYPNDDDNPKYPPITVPAGFVTDLASVPWYLWSWLPDDGPYMHAAIIHDWIYWDQGRLREEADNILWNDMTDLHVGWVIKEAIYKGVRWKGERAWQGNATLKASGERRVLKRFPDNPVTTWEEWKNQPDVFA